MSSSTPAFTPSKITHYNETRQPLLIGVYVVLLVLSNSVVITRIAAQIRYWNHLLLEDYLIVIALVFYLLRSRGVH